MCLFCAKLCNSLFFSPGLAKLHSVRNEQSLRKAETRKRAVAEKKEKRARKGKKEKRRNEMLSHESHSEPVVWRLFISYVFIFFKEKNSLYSSKNEDCCALRFL